MVSITKVSAAQAATYYRTDDHQEQSYYEKEGGAGHYHGKLAEAMGLAGERVTAASLNALANGDTPIGEHKNTANGIRRAGYDLTFSADKSISIAAQVLGDERLKQIHDRAVAEAMGRLEADFAETRIKEQGKSYYIHSGNLAWASFQHDTSRALDPQLHTHNLIFNYTQTQDGKLRAVEPLEIFRHQSHLDQQYQNHLARGLRAAGYGVEWQKHGSNYVAGIAGMPEELKEAYSKRTQAIEEAQRAKAEELGRPLTADEKEAITLGTRAAKGQPDMGKVRENWQAELQGHGYTQEQLKERLALAAEQQQEVAATMNPKEAIAAAAESISESTALFTRHDLAKEALKFGRDHIQSEIESAVESELPDDVIRLHGRYTTKAVLEAEERISNQVAASRDQVEAVGGDLSKHTHLTTGQREALELATTTTDRFIGIQGDAGSGKTTMMEAFRQTAETNGYEVSGLAPTGKAAEELQSGAGIQSRTIDSLLMRPEAEAGSGKDRIYVVDEATMVGTKQLDRLLSRIEREGARAVLMGDGKQLAAVQAGAMFSKLQQSGSPMAWATMSETLRQKTDLTRSVVSGFKAAHESPNPEIASAAIGGAFAQLSSAGRLHTAPVILNEEGEAVQHNLHALKKTLIERAGADFAAGKDAAILTGYNNEKDELNAKIRSHLKSLGKLENGRAATTRSPLNFDATDRQHQFPFSPGQIVSRADGKEYKIATVDRQRNTMELVGRDGTTLSVDAFAPGVREVSTEVEREFAAGDRIVFERNDRQLGLKNGQSATVRGWQGDQLQVAIGNREQLIDPERYPYINHGYALTAHKSQGQSIDHVHIWAPADRKMQNANQGYVYASRAKESVDIYTDDSEELAKNFASKQWKLNTADAELAASQKPNITQGRLAAIEQQREAKQPAATPKQIKYADRLAREQGIEVPPEAQRSSRALGAWIASALEGGAETKKATLPPTEKQLKYAKRLAERSGEEIPDGLTENRQALGAWIGEQLKADTRPDRAEPEKSEQPEPERELISLGRIKELAAEEGAIDPLLHSAEAESLYRHAGAAAEAGDLQGVDRALDMLAPGDTPEIQAYDTRTRLEFYAQALDIDDRAVAERMLDRLGEDDLEVREIFAEDPAALRDGLLGGGVRYANAPELSHALTAEGRTKELERIWDESRTETIIDAYAEQMPDRAEALRGEAFDMQMDEMESDLKTELHEQIEEALEAGWINEARDLMERNQEAFTDLELNALTEKYDAALTEWGEAEYERVLAKEIDDHIKIELEELERQPEAAQEAEAEQVRQPQHEEGRSQSGGGLSL